MKIVVFAHTPPPHHGQSYMVQLMLEGFGGDQRKRHGISPGTAREIECYHVNARLSQDFEDIGTFRAKKLFLLLRYSLKAIWCRLRYGAKILYYIPAPGKRSAVFRDWLAMFLCRPFFSQIIFHWHAVGLGQWLETAPPRTRLLTHRLLGNVDLSIVLGNYNRADAAKFSPKQIVVVPNGIPDPCPDFVTSILAQREARREARDKLLSSVQPAAERDAEASVFRVLFLAHCTPEKGLFDTLDGVALANKELVQKKSLLRIELSVAGQFVNAADRLRFDERIQKPDLQINSGDMASTSSRCCVSYKNFVTGDEKFRLFAENDCFCFPTYHYAESFGLVLVEAMAFGMQIISSDWRSIPELLPTGEMRLVPPKNPDAIAQALLEETRASFNPQMRKFFLKNFIIDEHLKRLADCFRQVEQPSRLRPSSEQTTEPGGK